MSDTYPPRYTPGDQQYRARGERIAQEAARAIFVEAPELIVVKLPREVFDMVVELVKKKKAQ